MTKDDSLKKALKVRARLAKERDSPNVKKKQEIYNKSIVRKRDKLESVRGKVKTVRPPAKEYNKWTPSAALKVCFTANSGSMPLTRGASQMRRTRGTPPNAPRKRKSNRQARATNAAADHFGSSSLYVQQIRDALANLILEVQSRSLDSIGHYENAVLEILLDETELKISQRKIIKCYWKKSRKMEVTHVNTVVPALAVHGSIQFSGGDVAFLQDTVVPMIGMEAKTGSCMLNVLKRELKSLADVMKTKCSKLTLVLQSDSAPANKNLFRMVVPLFDAKFAIHGKCLMHMISLAIAGHAHHYVWLALSFAVACSCRTATHRASSPEL